MFYAKMNDDEDDELPHFEADDDEEGAEHPHVDIVEEVDEVVIDEEPEEEGPEERRHSVIDSRWPQVHHRPILASPASGQPLRGVSDLDQKNSASRLRFRPPSP